MTLAQLRLLIDEEFPSRAPASEEGTVADLLAFSQLRLSDG